MVEIREADNVISMAIVIPTGVVSRVVGKLIEQRHCRRWMVVKGHCLTMTVHSFDGFYVRPSEGVDRRAPRERDLEHVFAGP